MTSEQKFLRYAWPCAEERLRRGLITQEQFDELRHLVETGGQPSREFLQTCFPGAVRRLGGKWGLEDVSEFWHKHKGSEGCHCDVYRARVTQLFGQFVRLDADGTLPIAVLNAYNLDLKPEDEVYIHLFTAIEKVE